ncbi:MAG: isocitrate/isopropylmalate dehydrogenase family protein [Nitrososphaerota archaeon]|jgi:isocitrate dehydrogenase (NAD+)|nr:isocitrate/isopropylmalate dehydrogenase family protein [Nitrososphaerota archaeon]MDG7046697.1 isocitrate/isopropylmalate dehydrogenase family protein [Nitrososphaerota archaeon]
MDQSEIIRGAEEKFGQLIEDQLKRIRAIESQGDWVDYTKLKRINIGIVPGDGIGPVITEQAKKILSFLIRDEIESGRVQIVDIEGLTLEERIKAGTPLPDKPLELLKRTDLLLKGPTTTPDENSSLPNVESANIAIRRLFDLFANVRPVKVPSKGIDWTFFRENTEGEYILGGKGVKIGDEMAFDFKVITSVGAERIIRLAFDHARMTGKKKVTVVTKANVIKSTDGLFLKVAKEVASRYPEIEWDSWYIDIMTAKLLDENRRRDFQVIVLPNLYGDIITDEAAEIQGGVGTAGSANIGKRYAMFEAIHGSATRMVQEGRAKYADPSSIIKALAMMLEHMGMVERARKLDNALDGCTAEIRMTGRSDGATAAQFTDCLLKRLSGEY